MDTKARSWAKSLIWRVLGIVLMPPIVLGVYWFIGDEAVVVAVWTTLIFHAVRVLLYYVHERVWQRISWGKK